MLALLWCLAVAVTAQTPQTVTLANGVVMPVILLGTGYMGDPDTQNRTVVNNVLKWLKAGARGIDTAYIYNDQEGISAAIKQSGVPRDEIFMLTKIPGVMNYTTAMFLLEADYRQLGQLDVVLSHWCDVNAQHPMPRGFECTTEHIQETWRAMEDFYRAGKAKAIGISNYCVSNIEDLLKTAVIKPHLHQIERNPLFQQRAMNKYCDDLGIPLQAYSPLVDADRQSESGPPAQILISEKTNGVVGMIASALDVSPAQVLLQWQIQTGWSATPRIMTANDQHISENVDVLMGKVPKLSDDQIAAINNMKQMDKCWPTAGFCPEHQSVEKWHTS